MESNHTHKPDVGDLKIAPEMRKRNHHVITVVSSLGTICLIAVIIYLTMAFMERPVEVRTMVVQKHQSNRPLTVLNAGGYVVPRIRATVASKVTGQLVEMDVEEGMHVTKGQVLARLDDHESRARFESAKANLVVAGARVKELEICLIDAKRDFDRVSTLLEENAGTREMADDKKTAMDRCEAQLNCSAEEVRAAKARLEVAARELDNYTIRAPFSGVVVSKNAQVGEMVSPVSAGGGFTRTGIATIVDMNSLEIAVDVNENYISNVKTGQKAIAVLDAYPDRQIPATVKTIIPTADRQRATVKVRLNFDRLEPWILPDMGVKVAFMNGGISSEDSREILTVPKVAIRRMDGKSIVFILQNDHVERREVSLGKTFGDNMEISAGLSSGNRVVVDGPDDLIDGCKIVEKGE